MQGATVLVPSSIKAEVGADAIAMISKSGMLQENLAITIDFGTNAEMAIKSGCGIFVGSAAAGPAIEGQHISHGMLASQGAICDLEYDWAGNAECSMNKCCPRMAIQWTWQRVKRLGSAACVPSGSREPAS